MEQKVILLILAILFNFGLKVSSINPLDPPILLGTFSAIAGEEDTATNTYRLPNNSMPLSYDLWLKTDIDKGIPDFQGSVKIKISILQTSDEITLHYRQIQIDKIDLLNAITGNVENADLKFTLDNEKEFLKIQLLTPKVVGSEIVLHITYHGLLRDDASGFYRASYKNKDNVDVWYATTQFEMTDARHAMPCYDEPGIRAQISLQLQHSSNLKAISNTKVKSTETVGDYVLTIFDTTPVMQTYLLAFLISDYDYKSNNDVRVEQRIYAVPEAIKNGEADFAVSVVDPILKGLESHFGVEYPLSKMDHAAIGSFRFGAMENFGLITYIDNGLLWKPQGDSEVRKKNIIELITHEYTHQFFGNIVSPKWWTYTWLNEGFATLFSAIIPSIVYPSEDYIYRFHVGSQRAAFNYDGNNAVPMNYYVETPTDISNRFDTISYSKAGSVLWMFQQAIGQEIFAKGLEYYLNEMKFKSATPDDLHRNLQKALNEAKPSNNMNIGEMMSTWENQKGYPRIRVEKYSVASTNKFEYVITQTSNAGGGRVYSVPISYMSSKLQASKEPKIFLKDVSHSFQSEDEWILLNCYQDGYYKTSYSSNIWTGIVKKLSTAHLEIPLINRAFIFDEIPLDFVQSSEGLKLLSFMTRETESIIWLRVPRIENALSRYFIGTSQYQSYQNFISALIKPQLDRVGFEPKSGESYKTEDIRRIVVGLSCKVHNEDCLKFKLEQFKASPFALPSNEMCAAFRLMNSTIYKSIGIESTSEQLFYSSFVCSSDSTIMENGLKKLIGSDVSMDTKQSLISNAVSSEFGVESLLDYIKKELSAVYRTLGSENFLSALKTLSNSINKKDFQIKFNELIDVSLQENFISKSQSISLKNDASNNVNWLNENPQIEEFFKAQVTTTSTPQSTTTDSSSALMLSTFVITICGVIKILI